MSLQIPPQEFNVLADRFVIRTRIPKELLTDAMVALRIRAARLSAGDAVTVQCMSHDHTELLAECEYRVLSVKEAMRTVETEGNNEIRQSMVATYTVERKTEWWVPKGAAPAVSQEAESGAGRYVADQAQVAWNPGKKVHEVKRGEAVIFSTADKALAHEIAQGKRPVPEAA